MSWSPGLDQSPADQDLTHVYNKTNEQHKTPDENKWQTKVNIFFGILCDIGDLVIDGGEIIEQSDKDGDYTAHGDLDLE